LNQDSVIRSLKLQLRLERGAILLIVLFLLCRWGYSYLQSRPYAILANGRPVAAVATYRQAAGVLEQVKGAVAGAKPSEVSFAQRVEIGRADPSARLVSETDAVKAVLEKVSLQLEKWAILVEGTPAAAVDSKEDAGRVLEAARRKFGSLAKDLMEEPQFKEQVDVRRMPVDVDLYRPSVDDALDVLLSGSRSGSGTYTVVSGDVAVNIARRHHMTLPELQALNPRKNLDRLQIGDELRIAETAGPGKARLTVVVRDREIRTEPILHRTETVSSMQVPAGKEVGISAGRDGLRRITLAVTYENGVKAGSEVVEETIIRNQTPRRIAIGIGHGR